VIALMGDQRLRVEQVGAFKINLPKINLPNISLPKFGGGAKKQEAAVFIDDNPNSAKTAAPKAKKGAAPAAPKAGTTTVKVRAAQAPAPKAGEKKPFFTDSKAASAPTLDELRSVKRGSGIKSTGYKAFPTRRMPGVSMQGFLDMARDLKK